MIEGADDIYSRNLRGLLVNFLSAVKPERAGAGNSQILQDAQGNKDDVSKDLENAKSKEEKIVIINLHLL